MRDEVRWDVCLATRSISQSVSVLRCRWPLFLVDPLPAYSQVCAAFLWHRAATRPIRPTSASDAPRPPTLRLSLVVITIVVPPIRPDRPPHPIDSIPPSLLVRPACEARARVAMTHNDAQARPSSVASPVSLAWRPARSQPRGKGSVESQRGQPASQSVQPSQPRLSA